MLSHRDICYSSVRQAPRRQGGNLASGTFFYVLQYYVLATLNPMYAAVDVGGSKTLLALFDKAGDVKEKIKFQTPPDYEEFKQELAANVDKLTTKDIQAVGLAIPGKVDRRNGVGLAFGNLAWENVPILEDVEHIFHAPVVIENDANLAALSEALLLKKEYKKVLYVTISTGIGTGLITEGRIDPAFEDAEAGHMLMEYDGKLQQWEDFVSGKAIVAHFGKTAKEIEDPQVWYMIARNIAVGLITLIATMTPEVIIIGGGVGSYFKKFEKRLLENLKLYETPLLPTPAIRAAARPEEAVIYGCYELVRQKYGKRT